jgi:hypothetical protein
MTIIESRPWDLDEALADFVDEWLEDGKSPDEIAAAMAEMVSRLSGPAKETNDVSTD